MRNFERSFSFSLSSEIMPDIEGVKSASLKTSFALILKGGESLSANEIDEIRSRTSLSPLFVSTQSSDTALLRSYARRLGAPLVNAGESADIAKRLAGCAFSVSEEIHGALLSLLSLTPAYVDAGDTDCRRLIARTSSLDMPRGVIIPYTKNRTLIIRTPSVDMREVRRAVDILSIY